MPYTHYGPPAHGEWVALPDFQAQQSKEGGWKATQSFQILREALDDLTFQNEFSIERPIGDLTPDVEDFWRFLGLASIQRVRSIAGGFSVISAEFAGFTGPSGQGTDKDAEPAPEPTPTFTLRGGIQERDILLHPKVIALAAPRDHKILSMCKKGEYVWDETNEISTHVIDEEGNDLYRPIQIQPTAGDAADFAKQIANGLHTYKFPSFMWEKTWESTEGVKAADIANLGLVDDTPEGNPPAFADRDWMLVSASQVQDGLKFRCTLEWELSDRGKWDELLYTE